MDNINRRSFIKKSAIGGAGLALLPSLLSASLSKAGEISNVQHPMNGLTPISIIDNACLLSFCSGQVSQASQNVLFADIQHPSKPIGNKARLAVNLPAFDKGFIQLIQKVKDNLDGLKGIEYLEGKHAMIFGWAAVNATEEFINTAINPANDGESKLIRMHQDAVIINGFSTGSDPTKANQKDVEQLLNAMLTRTVTRIHTLKPDADDGINWVNRMSAWRRQNVENVKQLADAIVNPKVSLAGEQFFSKKDEIIDAAIKLQHGAYLTPEKIVAIVNKTNYKSNYAKALADATKGIIAIDGYLNRSISKTQLKSILHI